MPILLSEHKNYIVNTENNPLFEMLKTKSVRVFKTERGQTIYPFSLEVNENSVTLKADYYIGIDWLAGQEFVYVEPKMNYQEQELEINFQKMLFDIYSANIDPKYTQNLIKIYWEEPLITIEQQKDRLTPFLIIQFLLLLKHIVRKGLKKSYYIVEKDFNNRIKGKIQLSKQLKQNIFKNKYTTHLCQYQEFGIDNLENRFLKKVLQFVISFKNTHPNYFAENDREIQQLINHCIPYFELISDEIPYKTLKNIATNPFFKEYEEAIRIGNHILKRFSYNITQTSQQKVAIPPFWIDMPKLFELYVYKKLQEIFSKEEIFYHFTADYTELDFLLNSPKYKMVIDAKYKTIYKEGKVIDDIRQISGYARLKNVYKTLKIDDDRLIDCLIIYPSLVNSDNFCIEDKEEISEYKNLYKLGVSLPLII